MSYRLEILSEAAKTGAWEITRVAGRDAIRIRGRDGVQTSFLTPSERSELEALLGAAPRALRHAGLPELAWSASRQAFEGAAEGVGRLVLMEISKHPEEAVLTALAASFARIQAQRAEIVRAAATRLEGAARDWADGPPPTLDEITARFGWESLALSPISAHAWLRDGGVFAGHSIEVSLDSKGAVLGAHLAG